LRRWCDHTSKTRKNCDSYHYEYVLPSHLCRCGAQLDLLYPEAEQRGRMHGEVNQTRETHKGIRQRKEKSEIEIVEERRSRRDFVFPVSFSSFLRRKPVLFLASLFFFLFVFLPLSPFSSLSLSLLSYTYLHIQADSTERIFPGKCKLFPVFHVFGPTFLKLSENLVEQNIKM